MAPGFRRCGPIDGPFDTHPLDRSGRHCGPGGMDDDLFRSQHESDPQWQDDCGHWLGFRYPEHTWWDSLEARFGHWREELAEGFAQAVTSHTLRQAAADLAKAELRFWHDNRLFTNRRRRLDRIQHYWRIGSRRSTSRAEARSEAWSAAFICFCVRQAGGGGALRYAWKHVTYVKAAIDNLQQNRPNTYKAYPVADPRATPTVGDLVCNWRDTRRSYEEIAAMRRAHGYTHCDLVVGTEADGSKIQLIGGNKSWGTVAQVEIALDANGLIAMTPDSQYIAVLRHS